MLAMTDLGAQHVFRNYLDLACIDRKKIKEIPSD